LRRFLGVFSFGAEVAFSIDTFGTVGGTAVAGSILSDVSAYETDLSLG